MRTDPRVARSRASILDACAEVLAEEGFSGVTIEAVAARSGAAKTTIYRHWESREALMIEAFGACSGPPGPPPATGSVREDVRAVLTGLAAKLNESDWRATMCSLLDAAGRDEGLARLHVATVAERRRQPTQDMLGQLCQSVDEDGIQLSDMEIMDQLIFIMMAAHDTTASTLSSTFYELALHPEWQTRIRDEAREALSTPIAQRPDKLPQTLMVIRETLRRHTPLKVIPRVTLEDLEFQGYALPKGTHLSVFPSFTHYMSEYWTKPEIFDPLRFSEQRAEHKKHHHLLWGCAGAPNRGLLINESPTLCAIGPLPMVSASGV